MDELHPGRALNALLFYMDAGIPLWLKKPHCIVTNKIPIKTSFYQQTQRKIGLYCPASFFIVSGLQPEDSNSNYGLQGRSSSPTTEKFL